MDINHLTGVLEEVVKRLDQTQNEKNKLDNMMERLDTLQNYIESQNQKQNLLEIKLSEMTRKLEQIILSPKQQTENKNDILASLRDLQFKEEGASLLSLPSGSVTDQTLHQPIQSSTDSSNILNEFMEKLERLEQKTDLLKTHIVDACDYVKSFSDLQIQEGRKLQEEIKQINTSITSLAARLDKENCTTTVVKKIDRVEILNDEHKTASKVSQSCNKLTSNVIQPTIEVKDDQHESRSEIFADSENEVHLQKFKDLGIGTFFNGYTFDFYVKDFKALIRSGKAIRGEHWHIKQYKTYMKGKVRFTKDGNVHVQFIHGRYPKEEGLRLLAITNIKVRAKICSVFKKGLQDLYLYAEDSKQDVYANGDTTIPLGYTSCDQIISDGYCEKDGSWCWAICIRYTIRVL